MLGSLYLAYDLLGGPHGPLRLLTRAVTYSILFGIGYGLGLGLTFGVASGLALGVTLAIELNRTAKRQDHYPLALEALFSLIRASAFSGALYPQVGLRFALLYGALLTAGQVCAYAFGVRPSMRFTISRGPQLTRALIRSTVLRPPAISLPRSCAARWCTIWSIPGCLRCGLGVVTGLVTGFGMAFSPHVEYYADNLPQRRMGVLGVG